MGTSQDPLDALTFDLVTWLDVCAEELLRAAVLHERVSKLELNQNKDLFYTILAKNTDIKSYCVGGRHTLFDAVALGLTDFVSALLSLSGGTKFSITNLVDTEAEYEEDGSMEGGEVSNPLGCLVSSNPVISAKEGVQYLLKKVKEGGEITFLIEYVKQKEKTAFNSNSYTTALKNFTDKFHNPESARHALNLIETANLLLKKGSHPLFYMSVLTTTSEKILNKPAEERTPRDYAMLAILGLVILKGYDAEEQLIVPDTVTICYKHSHKPAVITLNEAAHETLRGESETLLTLISAKKFEETGTNLYQTCRRVLEDMVKKEEKEQNENTTMKKFL